MDLKMLGLLLYLLVVVPAKIVEFFLEFVVFVDFFVVVVVHLVVILLRSRTVTQKT